MSKPKTSSGFSVIGVIAIILVIAAMSFGGWYIWSNHNNRNANKPASSGLNGKKNSTTGSTAKEDPYKGWKPYRNDTYGVGFKYPAEWAVSEVAAAEPATSATRQLAAITIRVNQDIKYSETVSFEILDESLAAAEEWYDKSFAQAPSNPVTKTTSNLKDKKSVQYTFDNESNGQKLYLFSVGNQTYSFSSINEAFNVNNDPNYWQKFDEVFESLTID